MFPANHIQVINKVCSLGRSQHHHFLHRCPAFAASHLPQHCQSSSASEPEKEPRFKPFHSFKTYYGARNPLISGQDYSVLGSNNKVPFGANERRRLKLQHKLVTDVLRLLKELEYAKQRGGVLGEERREDERRQHLIEHKLKSKKHLQIDPATGQVQENN